MKFYIDIPAEATFVMDPSASQLLPQSHRSAYIKLNTTISEEFLADAIADMMAHIREVFDEKYVPTVSINPHHPNFVRITWALGVPVSSQSVSFAAALISYPLHRRRIVA
jgi:hypothetical protein